jgi:hypothetical protein
MGVSRIRVSIDRLVMRGLDAAQQTALAAGLRHELSRLLAEQASRGEWARERRTPVLRLGRMPLEPGPAGSKKFATGLARRVARTLKP